MQAGVPTPPDDLLTLDPTVIEFGEGPAVPPIPVDFFDPGSEPFFRAGKRSPANCPACRRCDSSEKGTRFSRATRPVRWVRFPSKWYQLDLVSSEPIVVTYGSGATELWDLRVSNIGSSGEDGVSPGSLTATKDHPNGGLFTADFFLCPVLTFSRVDGTAVRVLDLCPSSPPDPTEPMQMQVSGPFVHDVDPDLGVVVPAGATFVPGIEHEDIGIPQVVVPMSATTLDLPPSVIHWVEPVQKVCMYFVECRNIVDPTNPQACDGCPLDCGDVCQGSRCPNDTCSTGYSTTCGADGCCLQLAWTGDCRPPAGEPKCPVERAVRLQPAGRLLRSGSRVLPGRQRVRVPGDVRSRRGYMRRHGCLLP